MINVVIKPQLVVIYLNKKHHTGNFLLYPCGTLESLKHLKLRIKCTPNKVELVLWYERKMRKFGVTV